MCRWLAVYLAGGGGAERFSGGTGLDGVLGDDGRIFTSRNTAGDVNQFSEPLSGARFLLAMPWSLLATGVGRHEYDDRLPSLAAEDLRRDVVAGPDHLPGARHPGRAGGPSGHRQTERGEIAMKIRPAPKPGSVTLEMNRRDDALLEMLAIVRLALDDADRREQREPERRDPARHDPPLVPARGRTRPPNRHWSTRRGGGC